MKPVNYTAFKERIKNAFGPEVDYSEEDYVCEDYWDEGREKVIACVKYYNDGNISCFIEPSSDF